MDYNIAIYCVAWVIVIWALFGLVAHADYFESLGLYLKENPNVCIMEANPNYTEYHNEIYDLTRSAINNWEYTLQQKTGGDWTFPIYQYSFESHDNKTPRDFPNCDIFMTFEQFANGKALGTTSFDYSNSNHKYSYITTWINSFENHKITIIIGGENPSASKKIEQKHLPLEAIYNIVLHEFGHALGLGHYQTLDDNCKGNDCAERSIMFPSIDPFSSNIKQITDEDIQMVVRLYGDDGFGYPNPVWNPKSCDFLDGKLDKCR
tara:strand:- start:197 stop:985 length:789 start_codon:yes stop_codon:yes gene_type:complete